LASRLKFAAAAYRKLGMGHRIIAFFNDAGSGVYNRYKIVKIEENVSPCSGTHNCTSYSSFYPSKYAIEMNAFNDDYYLWVDMGCFRYETDIFLNYPNPAKIQQQDKSKVLLLSVIPFTENELNRDYLSDFTKLNRISGTIFGGGKEILLEWHNKYYHMLETFIQNGRFIGKDQTIMNCVYLFNKNMCNLIHSPDICRDKWFYLQDYLCG
jgi:hypothetical protein